MYNKTELLEKNKDYIIEQYNNTEITQVEIAKELGVNPSTLSRYARKLGISKVLKNVWTDEKLNWLKENYNLTYKEMTKHLGLNDETIRLKLNELGIVRTTVYRPFKLDMSDKEFLADLENPKLNAPDIVEKYKDIYGIGESRIHQLRKEREIKLQINTLKTESLVEKLVKKILEDLDLAYIQEKRIGKYSIDFYLGFKICLEVHGDYWHNKPERIKSDNRKKKYLEDLGYKVIYVWELEVDKAKEYIRDYVKKQGLPIQ